MEGQIYIPAINMLLMICCVLLVIGFRTSEELASAYGVAVCGGILARLSSRKGKRKGKKKKKKKRRKEAKETTRNGVADFHLTFP